MKAKEKTHRWLLFPPLAGSIALAVLYFMFFGIGYRYGIVGDLTSFTAAFLPLLLALCILIASGTVFLLIKKHKWICRITAVVLALLCAGLCIVSDGSYTVNDIIEGQAVERFFAQVDEVNAGTDIEDELLTNHEPAGYMQLVQFRINDYYSAVDNAFEESGDPGYLYAFDVYVSRCLTADACCRSVPYAICGGSFLCILLCAFLTGAKRKGREKAEAGLYQELEDRIEQLHSEGILSDEEYDTKLDILERKRRKIG